MMKQMGFGLGHVSIQLSALESMGIESWLQSLGIEDSISRSDMRVTLMYDKRNCISFVDLDLLRGVYPASVIGVERIGKKGSQWDSIILRLESNAFNYLHEQLKKRYGFIHSSNDFTPYLSIKYKPTGSDFEKIEKAVEAGQIPSRLMPSGQLLFHKCTLMATTA